MSDRRTPMVSDELVAPTLDSMTVVKRWRVSLELARDDHASLSDEGIARLVEHLGDDRTTVDRQASGAVLVRMIVEATGEWPARSAAEDSLRTAADDVWAALGLPPFTITFVEVAPDSGD
jgi:hypothetical protein